MQIFWVYNYFVVKIKLSGSKYKALFQISVDIGQVVFASVVIPPLLPGFEKSGLNGILVVGGIMFTISMWYLSTVFAQKGKL